MESTQKNNEGENPKKCGCQSEKNEQKECGCQKHKQKHILKYALILGGIVALYFAWRKGYLDNVIELAKNGFSKQA